MKATDRELQKHDKFTRYQQTAREAAMVCPGLVRAPAVARARPYSAGSFAGSAGTTSFTAPRQPE
jgi:hypothetical protein